MSNQNGQQANSMNSKNHGLGQVAREKCEAILQKRVLRCIAVQEAKIEAKRPEALTIYLERNGLANKMTKYRALLEEMIAFFGQPDWRGSSTRKIPSSVRCPARCLNSVACPCPSSSRPLDHSAGTSSATCISSQRRFPRFASSTIGSVKLNYRTARAIAWPQSDFLI